MHLRNSAIRPRAAHLAPLAAALLLSGCFHQTRPVVTTTCIGQGCCCQTPRQFNNPGAGNWPACATGFTCVAMRPGGVLHPAGMLVDVHLCKADTAPLAAPVQPATGEPSFCRTDLP